MADNVLIGRFKQAPYTAAQLAAKNPVLLKGEVVYESDTGRFRIGNGTTPWNSLPSYGGEAVAAGAQMKTTHESTGELTIKPGMQVVTSSNRLSVAISSDNVDAEYSADAILVAPADSMFNFTGGANIGNIYMGWMPGSTPTYPDAKCCYAFHFVPTTGNLYDVFINQGTYVPY